MKKTIILIAMLMLVSISAYAEDPTPQQILQKVADIGILIVDMKATIVSTTILKKSGQPDQILGQYNRIYYQKMPSKLKVDNPSDGSFYIINAGKLYLKEVGKDLIETPCNESYMSSMDYIYNLPIFIASNEIGINRQFVNEGVHYYIIMAIPKANPKPYSKMLLTVNYDQGTILKMEIYNLGNNILLSNEALEISTVDGIPMPTKTEEIKYFSDATIYTDVQYSNIQLNKGVDDSIFIP
jgi:outer membrane lipoprotein-sorting protein